MIALSLVIPCGRGDETSLARLLASIDHQDFPKAQCETLLISQGNSEEAKAIGIRKAQGDIIGLLCTDNVLVDATFLSQMVAAAQAPEVIGAYTARYYYTQSDTILNRYFALLGANDPLCWWLGKSDRRSYDQPTYTHPMVSYRHRRLPSLGDNGCFFKRQALQLVVKDPKAFGSCMCICEDLRRLGFSTYAVTSNTIWHRTGESWPVYFKKRYRYVQTLYWKKLNIRRWRMVHGCVDWFKVFAFAICSLLLLPHLWMVFRGYRRVKDPAWFLHPVICSLLTLVYTWALCQQLPSLFRHWIDHKS